MSTATTHLVASGSGAGAPGDSSAKSISIYVLILVHFVLIASKIDGRTQTGTRKKAGIALTTIPLVRSCIYNDSFASLHGYLGPTVQGSRRRSVAAGTCRFSMPNFGQTSIATLDLTAYMHACL